MSTPQERREALEEAYDRGREWVVNTVESWLAEKDAEIERLQELLSLARRALIRTGYFTDEQVGDDIAPRITEIVSGVRADERRRTAEEIHTLLEAAVDSNGMLGLLTVDRICDEVGGSDDQQ